MFTVQECTILKKVKFRQFLQPAPRLAFRGQIFCTVANRFCTVFVQ